jgi:FkbM family methyltransferase
MRPLLQAVLDPVARALGYRFVRKRDFKNYYETDLLRRLFSRFDVDCVIDVGANRGQYHDMLRQNIGYTGHITSVEPISALAAALRQRANSENGRWQIHQAALGAQVGEAALNVMEKDDYSSFLQPTDNAPGAHAAANTVKAQETVRVDTLDNLFTTLAQQIKPRGWFLKLDTQGFDLEVVKGGGKAIEHMAAVQTEASFRALYQGMPSWKDTVNRFDELGFRITAFTPVAPSTQFPEALEMNCFFVNSRFL